MAAVIPNADVVSPLSSPSPYRRYSRRTSVSKTAPALKYGAFFKHFEDVPDEYQVTATASTFDDKLFEIKNVDNLAARVSDLYSALFFMGLMFVTALPGWILISGDYECCNVAWNISALLACSHYALNSTDNECYNETQLDDGTIFVWNSTPVFTVNAWRGDCSFD